MSCDVVFHPLDISFDAMVDLPRGPFVVGGVGVSFLYAGFVVLEMCSKHDWSEVIFKVVVEVLFVIVSRVQDKIHILV